MSSILAANRVVVFDLDNNQRKVLSRKELDDGYDSNERYNYGIKRWQRHVDIDIPVTKDTKGEASVCVAKVQIPASAYVGRIFGGYKEMWAVSPRD